MNILLVDDEYYFIQSLSASISWKELGIENVYVAYSAGQAMKVYESNTIDILISDVEMTCGSGLELIEWIQERGYGSINILLTGHEDFAYAQTAVKLHCFRYILKPVNRDEVVSVVKEAIAMLRDYDSRNSKEMYATNFWRDLCNGVIPPDQESIHQTLANYRLPLQWIHNEYYFMLLTVNSLQEDHIGGAVPSGMQALRTVLAKFMLQDLVIVDINSNSFVIIIDADSIGDNTEITQFAQQILQELLTVYRRWRFVIYQYIKAPLLSAGYVRELLQAYAANILPVDSRIISLQDSTFHSGQKVSDVSGKSLPIEKWSSWMFEKRTKDILRELGFILYRNKKVYSTKELVSYYYCLLAMVFKVISDQNLIPSEVMEKIAMHTDMIQATSSPEKFMHWAQSLLEKTETFLLDNTQSLLEEVKKFVRENIGDVSLNRNVIAEAVHISPNYLSFVFHKQSGEMLSAYITKERINTAKKLLLTTDMSLQQIAESVGFSDSSYFHKQFKKLTGQTPSNYRKR